MPWCWKLKQKRETHIYKTSTVTALQYIMYIIHSYVTKFYIIYMLWRENSPTSLSSDSCSVSTGPPSMIWNFKHSGNFCVLYEGNIRRYIFKDIFWVSRIFKEKSGLNQTIRKEHQILRKARIGKCRCLNHLMSFQIASSQNPKQINTEYNREFDPIGFVSLTLQSKANRLASIMVAFLSLSDSNANT